MFPPVDPYRNHEYRTDFRDARRDEVLREEKRSGRDYGRSFHLAGVAWRDLARDRRALAIVAANTVLALLVAGAVFVAAVMLADRGHGTLVLLGAFAVAFLGVSLVSRVFRAPLLALVEARWRRLPMTLPAAVRIAAGRRSPGLFEWPGDVVSRRGKLKGPDPTSAAASLLLIVGWAVVNNGIDGFGHSQTRIAIELSVGALLTVPVVVAFGALGAVYRLAAQRYAETGEVEGPFSKGDLAPP